MCEFSVFELYKNACKILGWTPRELICEALRRIDTGINPLIVKLPTGYGKTSITLSMGLALRENGVNWARVIHVLPMRSIVDDVELRLRDNMRGITNVPVRKQYMGSPSTPFYCGKGIIVTTLDTFIMNFFKVPASELGKLIMFGYSHYDIPRANIYSSAVVFDEFHLLSGIGGLNEELKSLSSVLVAIRSLCEAGVPLIISTATLPEILIKAISEILRRAGIELREDNILRWDKSGDELFANSRNKIKLSLEIIGWCDAMKILRAHDGKKILFVVNKVERAVSLFREISNLGTGAKVTLLHGRLREDVKRDSIKKMDEAHIVISTQVVEAGIDKSFDILITDPCPLDRFIQRAGRVARSERAVRGDVYVLELVDDKQYSGVYSEELTRSSMDFIEEFSGKEFPKLEFEEMLLEKMEEVYDIHVSLENLMDFIRLRTLIDLDEQPLLGRTEARDVLINLRGLTNTFGMVTIFDASKIDDELSYDFSVGVAEDFAKEILKSSRMGVVRDGDNLKHNLRNYIESVMKCFGEFRLVSFKRDFVNKILNAKEPLTLSLLKYGIEGLAVECIPDEGLVRI
ncbi:MAG: CRISPR-associated helicase Cas3' [Candidatus Bathyarchaeia archaeon]